MKIEQQPRDDHQVTLVVEIEQERMDRAKHRAARKMAERGKIPGFRPGKAPFDVVRRHYGDAAITEEAVDFLVDDVYPDVLKEAEIKPAAAGQLESVESLDPPRLKFVVPLMPTVDLGKYRAVRLPYEFVAPGEDKLLDSLEELRRMYGKTETVERAVQSGDFVMVDIKGTAAGAGAAEDQSSLSRDGFPVFVRPDDKDDEWPFPGFPRELIGLSAGDSKNVTHVYPGDHADEALRDKSVEFGVTVKTVRGVTLPELDDAFAQMVGGGQTLDELKQSLRENVERQAKAEYDDAYFVELIDKIKAGAKISYPPQVMEHEAEHVVEELKRRLAEQRLDLDTYLKMRQTDAGKFREEEVLPVARRRLERSLLIDEVARKAKIEVDEETLESAFKDNWATLSATDESFNKATKGGTRASRDLVDAVAVDTANRLMVSRVLDHIKAIANGETTPEPEEDEKPALTKARKTAPKKVPAPRSGKSTGKKSAGRSKAKPAPKKAAKRTTGK